MITKRDLRCCMSMLHRLGLVKNRNFNKTCADVVMIIREISQLDNNMSGIW